MKENKYKGKYRVEQSPDLRRLKEHNAKSWEKVVKVISEHRGSADFDTLSAAVKDHESGNAKAPHPYQFIIYCINKGWLKQKHITSQSSRPPPSAAD